MKYLAILAALLLTACENDIGLNQDNSTLTHVLIEWDENDESEGVQYYTVYLNQGAGWFKFADVDKASANLTGVTLPVDVAVSASSAELESEKSETLTVSENF